jgi:hypothetical protein
MSRCSVEWLILLAVMAAFTVLAVTGRWTELGLALVINGLLWYTIVPERQSRGQ